MIQQQIQINQLIEESRVSLQQLEKDMEKTKIIATAEGIIVTMNLRNSGQTVKLGEEIAQIVPSNSPLEIKAQISPQDIPMSLFRDYFVSFF